MAQNAGSLIEFQYWGAHEIWERLSREEHRGRYFFWFHEEFFSQAWFQHRTEEAIANAGPRYSAELNVDLPIAKLFDGLGRTNAFFERLKDFYAKIISDHRKIRGDCEDESLKTPTLELNESVRAITPLLWNPDDEATRTLDLESIGKLSSRITRTAWSIRDRLERLSKEWTEKSTAETGDAESRKKPDYGYERHLLYKLAGHTSELTDFSAGAESALANIPALLLVGEAGTGKSHLFCDVANQRLRNGLPTILLLGEQFGNGEPWSQIVKMLGLTCTREELLGALESAAQSSGARALILVDALNEGEGKTLWHKHLAGILATLSHYPWLSIAVSVRSSYEEVVIPEGLVPKKLVRAEHVGFADHEFEATESFFNHYGIKAPSVPLLNPEFQNPLFLKVFCKGLQNLGLTEVPLGLQGITAIFDFFIDSINDKLSRPENLDFDSRSHIVQHSVDKLVEMMAERGTTWLPRDESQAAVNSFLPGRSYESSLFRQLIAEGLLAEDRVPSNSDYANWIEAVHFSYERLADYSVTKRLLLQHLDLNNPEAAFSEDGPLGILVKDEMAAHRNRGLIEARSMQIPEVTGKEFADFVPHAARWRPVLEAFVQSVLWRTPSAISDATLAYVNANLVHDDYIFDQFLEVLLTVAANPTHPFNADLLDRKLKKLTLADRDAGGQSFYMNTTEKVTVPFTD